MKHFSILTLVICLFFLVGCGARVEVPPAYVGKILTKNGYKPDTVPPSKFRLDWCTYPGGYCDKLVLLEASDTPIEEKLKVFMPKDKLNLTVDARGTMSVTTEGAVVDQLYARVISQETDNNDVNVITANRIYKTYGVQAVRGIVRSELANYTIAEIMANRDVVSTKIHAAITKKLKETKTPIQISRFELADVQPPEVIVTAQEAAKEREIDIQKAEADAQVEMVRAERNLEVAKAERLVEREKAEAIAEQNKIAAESITAEVLEYKRLETAKEIYTALAASGNTIIIPADSSGFSNIADSAVFAKLVGKEVKK
jgi:regulator of protease activity HflC (stomatin/prohibitin superfamily)